VKHLARHGVIKHQALVESEGESIKSVHKMLQEAFGGAEFGVGSDFLGKEVALVEVLPTHVSHVVRARTTRAVVQNSLEIRSLGGFNGYV